MLGTNPPIVDQNDEHDNREYRDERATRDPFYGTVSRMTENAIRMLNPLNSLIHALKSPKILNKSTATYVLGLQNHIRGIAQIHLKSHNPV